MAHGSTDIVLVNFGCAEDTMAAIDRLQQWAEGTVWVVDNSAHDAEWITETAALQAFCASKPWVKMLVSGGNIGYGRACNLAFEVSQAEFLLLLNPDARIAQKDVSAMVALMTKERRLGALSPAVYWSEQQSFVMPMPSTQNPAALCSTALRTHLPELARYLALRSVVRTQLQMAADALIPASFLAGAVLLLRRAAVLQAGGLFDPAYFMFFEDSDLSLRLRRAGYALAVAPQIRAVHEYRHKAYKAALMARSQTYFFARNFPRFDHKGKTLRTLQHWHKPMDVQRWFQVLDGKLGSAEDFATKTGGLAVLAWSPSMLMEPAVCRPTTGAARCFDAAEWSLLEPGAYVALLADQASRLAPRWVYFEKA